MSLVDSAQNYQRYQCLNCDFIYDEAEGMPDYDIPAGTRWSDLSEDWYCPTCGSLKEDFELIEY